MLVRTRTIRYPIISTIPSLQWTGSRLQLFIGMVITSQRFVLPFSNVGLDTPNRRSCSFSRGTCLCYRHLPKQVGCFGVCCLGGPAKLAGPRRENGSFSGLENKSPMGGGTTDRGRLVSRQKTAVFLPREPGEALH
jgi:hypothetical protein